MEEASAPIMKYSQKNNFILTAGFDANIRIYQVYKTDTTVKDVYKTLLGHQLQITAMELCA